MYVVVSLFPSTAYILICTYMQNCYLRFLSVLLWLPSILRMTDFEQLQWPEGIGFHCTLMPRGSCWLLYYSAVRWTSIRMGQIGPLASTAVTPTSSLAALDSKCSCNMIYGHISVSFQLRLLKLHRMTWKKQHHHGVWPVLSNATITGFWTTLLWETLFLWFRQQAIYMKSTHFVFKCICTQEFQQLSLSINGTCHSFLHWRVAFTEFGMPNVHLQDLAIVFIFVM